MEDISYSDGTSHRKRGHPSNGSPPTDPLVTPLIKKSKQEPYLAGEEAREEDEEEESSADEPGLEIVEPSPAEEEGEDDMDMLSDIPPEALSAHTRSEFVNHMRPYVWVKYPSATSMEINAFINARWNLLKASRKFSAGKSGRRQSEVEMLEAGLAEEVEGGKPRSSRQRAAKRLARNAYLDTDDFEYLDSPASSAHSKDTESTGGKGKKGKQKMVTRRKKRRRGKGKGPLSKGEQRVPPMKIKMIGRSGESDSPIFFAESVESWDEGSESESAAVKVNPMLAQEQEGLDSETSSLALEERGEEERERELLGGSSRGASEGEAEADSDGEHADFCHTCKDGGELLCCDICPLAYHLKCLVPPMEAIPDDEWRCPRCEAEPLPGKIECILIWRWKEMVLEPSPGGVAGSSELEDDVMEEGTASGGGGVAKTPPKTYQIREFLVKWVGKSFWKTSWVSEIRIDVHQRQTLKHFIRKQGNMDMPLEPEVPVVPRRHKRRSTASHFDEKMEELEATLLKAGVQADWLEIQRVINKRTTRNGPEYLVKWKGLSYVRATWETLDENCGLKSATQAVKAYESLRKLMDPKKKEKKRGRRAKVVIEPVSKYEEQPDCISRTGGTLHPYQLEGLNWLRFSWSQHTNTILADEMGLGKTIQTIAFLYSLYKEGRSNGPFLISAPLSTIVNWSREFEFWAPELYVVTYTGDKDNRAAIREHEFSFVEGAIRKGNNRLFKVKDDVPFKFHVLLTSYEFVTVDCTVLQSIGWEVLVVDEAHRLKNNQSKFFRFLSNYDIKYKLLLTGTPLQNNLEELFHLLNFLNPVAFDSLEQFQEEFEDISKEDQVTKLHDLLAPHLLRRLKADVLKNIPPKRELIVRVDLAPMQKKFYRYILTKNFEKLNTRGGVSVSLLNIMMDLKKCCNHPYLFPSAAQDAPLTATGYYQGRELIQASGKFLVLEKMIKRLKEQGHRVLIFSQMTRMLDILEDFLEFLGLKYERIDGNVAGPDRQRSIDRFNDPGSEQFVFLLSTRAGGLGINLATADTVIIYDSDWNPHNDIQAFSRAHRIGQANKVMIYRFVTRSSVEERITEVAKKKMMLTHLVVRPGMGSGGTAPSLSKRELDDILRFGTEDLFKDETTDTTIHYDDRTIEALLDRDQEGDSSEVPGSENLLANEYLSSFKVASYVTKEVEDEEEEAETEILKEETTSQPDPDFWEKLLRHHYEQQRELEEAKLGKGKRVRKQVNYLDVSEDRGRDSDQSSYQQSDEHDTDTDSDAGQDFVVPGATKKRSGRGALAQPQVPKFSTPAGLPPLLAKLKDTLYVLGMNPRQRKGFLNSVMRYGMPPPDAFHSNWKSKELKNMSEVTFNAYVNLFMRHLCEPDNPNRTTYSDGVPVETISRQNILTRIGIMRLVRYKVNQYSTINGEYSLVEDIPAPTPATPPPAGPKPESAEGGVTQPATATAPSDAEGGAKPVAMDTNAAPKPVSMETAAAEKPEATAEEKPVAMETDVAANASSVSAGEVPTAQQTSETTPKTTPPPNEPGVEKMEVTEADKSPVPVSPEDKKEGAESAQQPATAESAQQPVTTAESAQQPATAESAQQPPTTAESAQQPATAESVIVYTGKVAPTAGVKQEGVISLASSSTASTSSSGSVISIKPPKEGELDFMFNIADGGFTDLHNNWAVEKKEGFAPKKWGRRHDYWLLKGLVVHGYCRWSEICSDRRFSILNRPFSEDANMTDSKSRFLLKRFKLLEQALAVEEQLHRASNGRLYQDPNNSVMQLHSCYTDLDCLADGHAALVPECLKGNRNSIILLKKALNKMEELLSEMKNDVSRLPTELSKLPSVSAQLKMDEISIISKLAKSPDTPSVITQAPPTHTGPQKTSGAAASSSVGEMVVVNKPAKQPTSSKYAIVSQQPGPQVQLPAGQVAMQTPEGLMMPVYSVANSSTKGTGTQAMSVVQGTGSSAITTTAGQTITIGVPAYVEGSNVYQLVPAVSGHAVSGQQVVYWPPVGQSSTTTVAGSQLAVVQGTSPQVLQPVQLSVASTGGAAVTLAAAQGTGQGKTAAKKTSVITID